MRIHRLVLDDFRGVAHREIALPDHGVIVLEGANEVGKSSTLEALDMLLTEKHSSRKAAVLAVKPVHRDAPSAVEAEISTGPYRFTLRKQWHSRPATALTVHAPRAEQLTGDEAHQRVRDILAETLDQDLWNALRVLQDVSPGAGRGEAALGGSSALTAALDAAAGSARADEDAAGAQSLFAAAAERCARFWTATGRPTGRHRTCAEELTAARAEAARAREALDLLSDDADRHAELSADRADVQQELTARTEEAAALAEVVADLAARRDRLERARERAGSATRAAAAARDALAARRAEVADLARRTAALDQDAARAADLGPAAEDARARATAAAAAAEGSAAALDAAEEAAEAAREAVRRTADGAALRTARRRLAAVTAAQGEVRATATALAALRVDATAVRAVEAADDAVRRLRARAEAVAARVVVEATAVEVLVDGRPVAAGASCEHAATRPLTVDVSGFATVRVLPGADTGPVADELDGAQERLRALLAAAGVEDVAQARAAHEERRAAQAAADVARAQLTQLTADADADALRAEVERLAAELGGSATPGGEDEPGDLPALRAAEAAAREEVQRQRAGARRARAEAADLAGAADRLAHDLTALRTRLELSRAEAAAVTARLVAARAAEADAALEDAAARTAAEASGAQEEVRALEADLAARDETTVLRRAREVRTALDALATRRDELDDALVHLEARLSVMGGEARQEAWDEAESRVQRLAEEHAGLERRAAAARLLLRTLERHRDTQRRRYVQPFTDRLEELGRTVFGDTFAITLDDDLRIVQRTLDGRTVAYDQLSTGAREQLAVLLRLACATLVDPADGVPVVLDDALGHSDPERLRRLAAVFAQVAPTTQVLLLAPGPGLHTDLPGAVVVRLGDPAGDGAEPVRTPAAADASRG